LRAALFNELEDFTSKPLYLKSQPFLKPPKSQDMRASLPTKAAFAAFVITLLTACGSGLQEETTTQEQSPTLTVAELEKYIQEQLILAQPGDTIHRRSQ